eukprot:2133876-Amphidinium_carterae.1
MYNDETKDIDENDKNGENMQALNIYEMEKGTISMLNKMNIKLPIPTQFDGRYPRFNEWAGGHRAQQFSLLRTIMQPSWTSDTRQFTKKYYKWLEDINRYEAENGRGTCTDHVKIATVVNNFKGNIAQT